MTRAAKSAGIFLCVGAFALITYGPSLGLPFIGDDYVFLDQTRDAPFDRLWSFANVDFGWYRPWSRELHFWALQHLIGLHPAGFRLFGAILWVAALGLYAAIVRRLSSSSVAAIAAFGVAALALWGTPLLWISGSQDLWMLVFTLASVLLFVSGRVHRALLPFGLALLCKETAAVLPVLLCAYIAIVERRRPADTLRRVAPFLVLLGAWLSVHPTLQARLFHSGAMTPELEHRPPLPAIVARTLLSVLNLDALPRPSEWSGWEVAGVAASAAILACGAALALRRPSGSGAAPAGSTPPRRIVAFALCWAVIGWLPLALPSIAWHAYYGCLGALGAWFGLALALARHRRIAVTVIAVLALLRGAEAYTPSWDWGSEWYLRRAGNVVAAIERELLRQHPSLPAQSRVYFGHVPNNIGLIAGRSPALRVWYRDRTLTAGFFSSYRPRPVAFANGPDYFFRFDSLAGLVEIAAGPEDIQAGMRRNRDWEADHEKLAMLFLRSGDGWRAAVEFEKLSMLPARSDAAVFAGVCWEALGDTARADSLVESARQRMHLPSADVQAWVSRLQATLPANAP